MTPAIEGQGRYAESTGHEGTMAAGDVEWISAGRGVWHSGSAAPPVKAFQLWVALPPERDGKGELAVFDHSDAAIEFEAVADARFVLGTAIPHLHDLHLAITRYTPAPQR